MSILFRKFLLNNQKTIILRHKEAHSQIVSHRNLSIVPSLYDGEHDPATKFFSPNVQVLLKRITRPNFDKVFRKRTNSGVKVLETPTYKFLTNDELELEMAKVKVKANELLQMPPVVKIHEPINEVISKDPALLGYDTSKYLFTDISCGIKNEHRIIVERDPDGTLKSCDHDIRKKLNQVYFPINGRKIKDPLMFSDPEKFSSLLDRNEYEFVLDRACIQYEPDEPEYQKITSMTYQHVDMTHNYEYLRSTRHFGALVFYLIWHQNIDSLMLELLQNGAVRDSVVLMALGQAIQGNVTGGNVAATLSQQILNTPIQLTKLESVSEADIELDTKCVDAVATYITKDSSMKSQQELALQGFREYYQQLVELTRGLKKAHGNV